MKIHRKIAQPIFKLSSQKRKISNVMQVQLVTPEPCLSSCKIPRLWQYVKSCGCHIHSVSCTIFNVDYCANDISVGDENVSGENRT